MWGPREKGQQPEMNAAASTLLLPGKGCEGYASTPWLAAQGAKDVRKPTSDLAKVLVNLLLPPIVFTYSMTLLTFGYHFRHPRGVWLASLLGILPVAFAARFGGGGGLQKLSIVLFALAWAGGVIAGELNYWHFTQPFFFLESLKTYSNIDPLDVDGNRLMDAGRVHFAEGTRLATDMGMSFTTWDTYCVAPITIGAGLPTKGGDSSQAFYDLWAVGVNCCSPGQTNFHCGEYGNPAARSGLRQESAEQRKYFNLAVQQAEAAYGIRAPHPKFFYWVQDPQKEESLFFQAGFENWVEANAAHFLANALFLVAFLVASAHAPRGSWDGP